MHCLASKRLFFIPCFKSTPFLLPTPAMSKANPQQYGCTYQGSNEQSRVEFYERDGVNMDFYPTTGTCKTSMDHPTQGHTQMFRRGLDDAQFQAVLDNPRTHTGQGYQTKASQYYKGK